MVQTQDSETRYMICMVKYEDSKKQNSAVRGSEMPGGPRGSHPRSTAKRETAATALACLPAPKAQFQWLTYPDSHRRPSGLDTTSMKFGRYFIYFLHDIRLCCPVANRTLTLKQ